GPDRRQRQFTDAVEAQKISQLSAASSVPPAPSAAVLKAASNLPPADPAPMADSETDPYSVAGTVRFRPGKSEVQFGRKHETVRPRLNLAAQTAALELPSPVILA